ncbi:MAG TPA: hypothetical protein VFR07_00010 [Mycobacteriales bacterium]|jgi:hypothetical protein|nr:hypothetical protein [Mycobacteriales bacterium]
MTVHASVAPDRTILRSTTLGSTSSTTHTTPCTTAVLSKTVL